MTDKEHLTWIFNRLVNIHHENPLYDYMHRLRKIIDGMPGPSPLYASGDEAADLLVRNAIDALPHDDEGLSEEDLASLRERYARMPATDWFKAAYEDRPLGPGFHYD